MIYLHNIKYYESLESALWDPTRNVYPEFSYSGRGSDSDSRKFLNEDLRSKINDCSGVSLQS